MKKTLFSALLSAQIAFGANLVVLDPAAIEMIYSLGAQDQIKAIAKTSMSKIWPADEVAKLPSVGGYIKPNLEKIVALKPDLVIASYHSTSTADELKNLGIKSMVLNANSIDEICANLDKIAQIVEAKAKSSEICNEIQAKFDGKTALQGKKGLFVFSSNPLMAFSAKTLPGDILIKFGAKNVADGLQGDTPIINSEYILAQNPDFIAVVGSNVETFLQNNETLKNTNAYKNGKIVAAKMTILRGSQRIGESVDELYESLK